MSGYRLRPFEPRDVAAVAALEVACNPSPWSAEALAPYAEGGDSKSGLVAELEGSVVGYLIASRAADEAEILQLGVAPSHRRRGIARILLRELFARLKASGTGAVYLEVRAGNAAALALYASLGFVEAGVRKGYYEANAENAVLLKRALDKG